MIAGGVRVLMILVGALAAFALWPARGVAPVSTPLAARDITALEAALAASEARHSDLREGTDKQILWAGEAGQRQDWAVVYVHGFSASRDEIRPVPDRVAAALGANLYFARLTGHGRSDEAMAEGRAEAWMADMVDALSIAQTLGERVLVIGTSTGGTLAALAATDPDLAASIDAAVLVSPNFSVGRVPDWVLTRPFVDVWGPWVFGPTRGFTPENAETERVWTYAYPTEAVLPLGPLIAAAKRRDPSTASMPALFIYSEADQVVDARATHRWAWGWGGGAERMMVEPGPGVEAQSHVVAGDIRSPGMTQAAVDRIVAFLRGLQ